MGDECLDTQALRFLTADQDAVGALIGNHSRPGTAFGCCCRIQGIDDAYDFRGGRMLERKDVHFLVAALIDALDDAHNPVHVVGAIGNDQHVRAGVGREMPVLRNQRPQHRHQLRGANVLDCNDLGNDLIGRGADAIRQVVTGYLARIGIRNDLDDLACGHRNEAVHLEDCEERLIERIGRHGRVRQHRDLGADTRIDDEVLAGDLTHRFDDLCEVSILVVRRNRWLPLGESQGTRDPSRKRGEQARSQEARTGFGLS